MQEKRNAPPPKSLEAFLSPSSIAVVGAAQSEGKLGHTIVQSLIDFGYRGKIYPVNPNATEILGLKCYPDLSAIIKSTGSRPDSVYITVPPPVVEECLKDAVSTGIGSVTVLSSSLTAKGAGNGKESELVDMLRRNGIHMLGPNCLGVHNPLTHVTFNSRLYQQSGPVAFISQSGSMTELFLLSMERRGIGTRFAVSTGNEADLTICDFMDYASDLEEVRVIAAYVEEIRDPQRFVESCRKLDRSKVVIIYKAGLTRLGGEAASSHTGAVAGASDAYGALFRKGNVVYARTYDEMAELVVAAASGLRPAGRKAAVISAPGGLCVSLSDALDRCGFDLPPFGKTAESHLLGTVPPGVSVRNPLDLTMAATTDLKLYGDCISTVSEYGDADVIFVGAPTSYSSGEFVNVIKGLKGKSSKPVAVVWTGEAESVYEGIRALGSEGIATFRSPEAAASSISSLIVHEQRHAFIDSIQFPSFFAVKKKGSARWLDTYEIASLLSQHRIANYEAAVVSSLSEAKAAAERTGYPIVLKLSSSALIHKSEAGGVILGIRTADELAGAMARLRSLAEEKLPGSSYRFTISRQVMAGVELVVGSFRAMGGAVIMFGLGGVFVELSDLRSFAFCPIGREEALELVKDSGLGRLLDGYRGIRISREELTDFLVRVSLMVAAEPGILEMDINPLIANSDGLWPVDVRILHQSESQ